MPLDLVNSASKSECETGCPDQVKYYVDVNETC